MRLFSYGYAINQRRKCRILLRLARNQRDTRLIILGTQYHLEYANYHFRRELSNDTNVIITRYKHLSLNTRYHEGYVEHYAHLPTSI